MSTATLTQRHRAQQLLLRRATIAAVSKLWPALDWARLDATYPDFAVQVGRLVQTNRATSAGLASTYLRAFRRAAGIPGPLKVVFAQPLIVDQFTASLRVTSVVAAKNAATAGTPADVAMRNALTQASGAMSRMVLDAGRDTITQTTVTDPRSVGWHRVGNGECDWCSMLIDRGDVFREETASFEAHDRCRCLAEPVYA